MRLPKLPYTIRQKQSEIVNIRGINFSDNFKDGHLADSDNISARRYPYFSARHSRQPLTEYAQVTAMGAWNNLVVVQNGRLLYDGVDVGAVTAGEKQFAVVNTKIVIWPDKVYYDIDSKKIIPLAAKQSGTGATFATNKITVTWDVDLTKHFKAGDGITISGCEKETGNNKDIVIKKVAKKVLTFEDDTLKEATETAAITFERKVPDLDYICESENRLWGCSNKDKCIFASALGDPTNFYVYNGLSTDSYTLAIGSEGDFTGCCKLSSSVLFWKTNALHKILGSFPAEYALYSYTIEGVKAGCHKSMRVLNDTLLYMGEHGIYSYNGGSTRFISDIFGEHRFSDAVAGDDGNTYYLSAKEGAEWYLFTYNLTSGIWLLEDNTRVVDFARKGKDIYLLTGAGKIYIEDSGKTDTDMEWSMLFKPFYETVDGKKRYSYLLLRVDVPAGSWMKVEVRHDNSVWIEAAKVTGNSAGVAVLPVKVNRCDKFELRLSGKGDFTLLNITRQYSLGGVR